MALLTLEPDSNFNLQVGESYTLSKPGYRLIPLEVPMELADSNNKYLGKVKVTRLLVESNHTDITFKVLKLFSPQESEVYTANFIKP
jgi:hypothetical protein